MLLAAAWSLAGILALLAYAGCAGRDGSDARAVAIADRVMARLGGRERWNSVPGLAWTFQAAVGDTLRPGRRHLWDLRTGWHRVEGRTRQGQSFVIVSQLDSLRGRAWVDGIAIEGDSLQKLLRRGHSLWTNDMYWMLMPYKLRDPGVHLAYAGDTAVAGAAYDRLALSFERVGETPGDRYWVWVNRANDRIERWDYVLEGDQPPPKSWTWEGWEQHAGLWFPTTHKNGEQIIYTRDVERIEGMPATALAAP
jgi:hypothetical protein